MLTGGRTPIHFTRVRESNPPRFCFLRNPARSISRPLLRSPQRVATVLSGSVRKPPTGRAATVPMERPATAAYASRRRRFSLPQSREGKSRRRRRRTSPVAHSRVFGCVRHGDRSCRPAAWRPAIAMATQRASARAAPGRALANHRAIGPGDPPSLLVSDSGRSCELKQGRRSLTRALVRSALIS